SVLMPVRPDKHRPQRIDGALMWDLEFEGVKIHGNGLQRYAPISTDWEKGYGITEENFHWKDYGLTLDSEWWSVTTNRNAGGTHWFSGNGDVGLLDTTVAGPNNHGLNYWGFTLEDDADADIESDFRYYHQPGGDVSSGIDRAAFGLMLSTDADPAQGINRFSVLANQGDGIALMGHAGDLVAHTNLNVDTSSGGWSDWFRLKWHIDQGTVNYQGTASLYDGAGNLLFTGPTTDLGIPNGTKIWAGYTTGPNSGGGPVSSFSGLSAIQVDNFHYEKGFINHGPVWVVEKAHMYTMVETPLITSFPVNSNLRGFIHEPDGTYVIYSKLSGPDWLSIDEKGTLSGTPSLFDIGENEFTIKIEDPEGLSATGQLSVTVSPLSSGSFSLVPVEDHSVDSQNPTNNTSEGTGRGLTVQKNRKECFLKFDLSAVRGDVVTNAILRLKVSDPDDTMVQTAWFVSDDSWQQETLTYSNKPAFTTVLVSDFPVPAKDWWVELDVTDQIQNEWSGDQLFSIGFSSANGFKAGYHSREAIPGYRPELVVQTASINNVAPVDPGRVIVGQGAMENDAYAVNLNDVVTDPDEDTVFFQIVSGPAWLTVDLNGIASGTPLAGDVGVNSWDIQVTDALNGWTPAVLKLSVFPVGSTDKVTLNPIADSYVRSGGQTNTNYGTKEYLKVRGGGSREIYLKFDISTIAGDVFDAVLRLKVDPSSTTNADIHTAYFIPDDSWGETTITWDTKPPAGIALDAAPRPGIGSWIELDVTDQVQAEWAGDGIFSVTLHSPLTQISQYYSRETADTNDWLQLVVTAGHTGWSEFIQTNGLTGVATDDAVTDFLGFSYGGNPTNSSILDTSPWVVHPTDDNVGFHYLEPAQAQGIEKIAIIAGSDRAK
ncbi:DNRLRE domain-containing protein, partial [Planctomycetota bacterium]